MRTFYEILTLAKDGGKPEYDELLYALLMSDALHTFDHEFIIHLPYDLMKQKQLEFRAEESFQRVKRALDKSPKEWLGWDNDPANPQYLKRRKVAMRLVEMALNGELGA